MYLERTTTDNLTQPHKVDPPPTMCVGLTLNYIKMPKVKRKIMVAFEMTNLHIMIERY